MMQISIRARAAYSRLYQKYNDIDIFVEDSTYTGVYEKIINRILSGKAKVARVTPLGPRNVVEEAARSDSGPHNRPRLYIVDGDLDILSRGKNDKVKNLYRLKVYSLENLLIDNEAIKKYCKFSCPGIDELTCSIKCDVDGLFEEMQKYLLSYIAALAIARRLDLNGGISSINPHSVSKFSSGRGLAHARI
jgi:hypothetical protein